MSQVPMTSQADAFSYCMGSVVSISSRIYQVLWLQETNTPAHFAPESVTKNGKVFYKFVTWVGQHFVPETGFVEPKEVNAMALKFQWTVP
jgi:hypothetical protein